MDDYKRYSYARDQLYSLVVKVRQLDESISTKRRTPQLQSALDMVRLLCAEAASAWEDGDALEVQINRYTQETIPGFDDLRGEMKNSWKDHKS